ncbi:VOC family protein [Ectothiorhodospiraceae bacterium WFHF3C12]|nr:VOC family protein [Ectothiorhodospiraceae bacterium WFHF3C12]
MRFMIIRKADADTEAEIMPGEALLDAMGRYNDRLVNAGVMVDGAGLKPSSYGVRIKFSDGKPTVTDGPFTETKELIAGYTVIDVASQDEAVEWALQWPSLDGDGEAELELRRFFEMEEFTQGDALDRIANQFDRLQRQPSGTCPYLFFPGTCREAMETYADCLGGHVEAMLTHAETPAAGEASPEWQDKIIHACIRAGRWQLMASDAPPGYYERPQGFSVQVAIDDPARAEQAFNRLAEGGEIRMPMSETFWAHRFGMLVDRFGTPWMINCETPA